MIQKVSTVQQVEYLDFKCNEVWTLKWVMLRNMKRAVLFGLVWLMVKSLTSELQKSYMFCIQIYFRTVFFCQCMSMKDTCLKSSICYKVTIKYH